MYLPFSACRSASIKKQAFVGLGGNKENSLLLLNQALEAIASIKEVSCVRTSSFYRTTPVSPVPQEDYVNAVCTFKTALSADILLRYLQEIEKKLGKVPKPRECPRPIDLDLLFLGKEMIQTGELKVPHPRWKERLFVLIPLLDLVEEVEVPDAAAPDGIAVLKLKKCIEVHTNTHNEIVERIL